MGLDTSKNGVMSIEETTQLNAVVLECEWVRPGHELWQGDGDSESPNIPVGTLLAVRLQKLGLSGSESRSSIWICFGTFSDVGQLKVQNDDLSTINQTIIDYVYPRAFNGMFSKLDDLISCEVIDPQTQEAITIQDNLMFDHIHVPQEMIDKYDTLLSAVAVSK